MKNRVALVIIYNHQYTKNIEVLEAIYGERFSHIYHLMPFYKGEKENVIPVYENSFYFQGYVAQGYKTYFKKEFEHYFFVGDDLLLNPAINEDNYQEHLDLTADDCFIPSMSPIHYNGHYWPNYKYFVNYTMQQKGIEVDGQIPSYNEALKKIEERGFDMRPIQRNQVYKEAPQPQPSRRAKITSILKKEKPATPEKQTYDLAYPMVVAYSDTFVVSAKVMKEFVHYCGVFAATNLFVEVAIPTALALTAEKIVMQKDIKLGGRALWTEEDFKVLESYQNNLDLLLSDFPDGHLFLHPIKLSKWQTTLKTQS